MYYDWNKVHGHNIEIGGKALLQNFKEKEDTGKLKSNWEDTVYEVVDKCSGSPSYIIKPVSKPGFKAKRVHIKNIMGCQYLVSNHLLKPFLKPHPLLLSKLKS